MEIVKAKKIVIFFIIIFFNFSLMIPENLKLSRLSDNQLVLQYQKGNYKEIIKYSESVINKRKNKNNLRKLYIFIGASYEKTNNLKKAKTYYEKAKNIDNNSSLFYNIDINSLPELRKTFGMEGVISKESSGKKSFFKSPVFIASALIITIAATYFIIKSLKKDNTDTDDDNNEQHNTSTLIINHNNTYVSSIPNEWIDKVKSKIKLHYAHTSHGSQLTKGLEILRNRYSRLSYTLDYYRLPNSSNLCILDGQSNGDDYITPDLYWENGGDSYTKDTLNKYSSINVSMWAWCTQLNYYSESEVNNYLNKMNELEKAFPNVTFVYMTGNAQATGEEGYNRYLRNEQIRDYCKKNKKVLFDFADLDSWYNGEQATYTYNGKKIPKEHPHYNGDEWGHTTLSSCENKAKALWYLLARIEGWNG